MRRLPGGALLAIVRERVPVARLEAGDGSVAQAIDASGATIAPVPTAPSDPALATTDRTRDRPAPAAARKRSRPTPPGAARFVTAALELIETHGCPRHRPRRAPSACRRSTATLGWRVWLADGGPEVTFGSEATDEQLERLAQLLDARLDAVALGRAHRPALPRPRDPARGGDTNTNASSDTDADTSGAANDPAHASRERHGARVGNAHRPVSTRGRTRVPTGWEDGPSRDERARKRRQGADASGRPQSSSVDTALQRLGGNEMARNEDLLIGLDIGTTKICVIRRGTDGRTGVDVVGIGTHPSRGLRKGVVVDIDATVESIKAAVEEAELMADCEITSVYAGIAGSHIRGINSHGVVAVKDREVKDGDVKRSDRRREGRRHSDGP